MTQKKRGNCHINNKKQTKKYQIISNILFKYGHTYFIIETAWQLAYILPEQLQFYTIVVHTFIFFSISAMQVPCIQLFQTLGKMENGFQVTILDSKALESWNFNWILIWPSILSYKIFNFIGKVSRDLGHYERHKLGNIHYIRLLRHY